MYLYQECRPPSRTKPVPPKKPERLSLQRTTSLQSVDEALSHNTTSSSSSSRVPTSPTSCIPSSPTSPNSRVPNLQTWPSVDTEMFSNGTKGMHERLDCRSPESIYEPSSRNLYGSYTGDGGVRMIIESSHASTENLNHRLNPQGATSTSTTTVVERPYHNHTTSFHNSQSNNRQNYRCHSPDAGYHLDRRDDSEIYHEENLYSHVGLNGHYSSHYHATTTTTTTAAHHRLPHHSHTSHHYSPHHTLPTVTSRNSGQLSVATSPRPHEQWC